MSYLIAPNGSVMQRFIGTIDASKLKLFVKKHER